MRDRALFYGFCEGYGEDPSTTRGLGPLVDWFISKEFSSGIILDRVLIQVSSKTRGHTDDQWQVQVTC